MINCMKDTSGFRIRLAYGLIFIFGLALITRLFLLQIVQHSYYENEANKQYFAVSSGYFSRGSIFFKDKNSTLASAATLKTGFLLALNPKLMENPEEVFEKISKIAEIDKDLFFKSASKKEDIYEEIGRQLTKEQSEQIKGLGLKAVDVYPELWRYYPAANFASRVLGFVGYNEDKLEGRYGLEKYYENILSRGEEEFSSNPFAEIITGIKKIVKGDYKKGDIVLTIDPEAQNILETELKKAQEKYSAEMAGGVIIEPKTGKILAMSAKPDFNPNAYNEEKDFSVFLNPLVQNVFEMGSIMKPLTLAAALDQNKITPETTYENKGYVIINNKKIENYDISKSLGVVPMQEVLNQSLNTGAVFVMQKLGEEKFKEYVLNYGLGEKTGIDLPDEISGLISNLDSGRDIEYATASFGQGIAVTPIEMACALSSLANGGILMKPYVVEKIDAEEGVDEEITPQEKRRVLKKETSEEINRMLAKVVDEALMGGIYKNEHYTIAAKTGTAQYKQEGSFGYTEDQYIHTFFGYAPAFDAKFLTFLFLVKPQEVKYASHSLSEPFMNITKFLLNYYEIPPDR